MTECDAVLSSIRLGDAAREPRCTVGLLTWNPREEVWAVIRALFDQRETPLEIVWVDNASTNGAPEKLQRDFPSLPVCHRLAENVGFCGGHNLMSRHCRTPYYFALSQDVLLAPDYIEKLCNWFDEDLQLALAGGLLVQVEGLDDFTSGGAEKAASVYSAGIVYPRSRFPFELGMGGPIQARYQEREYVPGVDGCAMALRMEACRASSLDPGDVLPPEFFAYGEEVDLAIRLARRGFKCGREGTTRAIHEHHSSGGYYRPRIGGRFVANHWLTSLRHEGWGDLLRDLPYIVRGELQYWLPIYWRNPGAVFFGIGYFLQHCLGARRFYRAFEERFGPTRKRMQAYKRECLEAVRAMKA